MLNELNDKSHHINKMSIDPKERFAFKKKICPICGRLLWRDKDFYLLHGLKPYAYCKDCQRKRRRDLYQRKQPNGIRLDKNGNIKEYINGRAHVYWSPMMIKWLIDNYHTTKNYDLASELGVSVCTMIRKAKSLGLSKNSEWMKRVARDNSILGGLAMKRKYKKRRAYLSQASSFTCK